MRNIWLCIILAIAVLLIGCPATPQSTARDVAAAGQGAILAAQSICSANPTQAGCKVIPQAISAQNALITSAETYCGFSVTNPPTDPNAKCNPVASLLPALQAATANMNQFITELKGVK